MLVTDCVAKQRYRPILGKSERYLYDLDAYAIANGWRFPNDPPNVTLTPAQQEERIVMVTTGLDHIADVFEEPRMPGETDDEVVVRLKRYFP
jgi:hypothetical protein